MRLDLLHPLLTPVVLALAVIAATCGCAGETAETTPEPARPGEEAEGTEPAAEGYPSATLSNDAVTVKIWLPDAERGHYRGPRFDWSGQIAQATWKGHTFFGKLRTKDDPTGGDTNASGPAGEFGMAGPQSYEEAEVGRTFLKIGVGRLRKAEDREYHFNREYEIVEPGEWEIDRADDAIEFRQSMSDRGWGYAYTKRLELLDEEPGFRIVHTLENTGERELDTTHYSHNFIRIDDTPIGDGYTVELPFEVEGQVKPGDGTGVEGNAITFREPLSGSFFAALEGFEGADDNHARVINTKTGAGVEIDGDAAPVMYNLYAEKTAFCPEPFIGIQLEPGRSKTWTITYTFFKAEER